MNRLERSARWLKYKCGLGDSSAVTVALRPYYDQFLSLLYEQQGLPRKMHGTEEIRIRPAHRNYRDSHETEVFQYLRSVTHAGDVVLEVGANVGIFTVLLARCVAPSGRVFAFEPAPLTRAALEDHLALNGAQNVVTVVPEALGSECGTSDFFVEEMSGQNTLSKTHSRIPGAKRISVSVNTIDAFCDANEIAPSLIKIDVEGFEHSVLRGAMQTLRKACPRVIVEFHPMLWNETGTSFEEIRALIEEAAYESMPLTGQRDPFREYGHVVLEPMQKSWN